MFYILNDILWDDEQGMTSLFQALVLCFRLHFTKDSTTINTAAATVRQLVSVVFERVVAEDAVPSQRKHHMPDELAMKKNHIVKSVPTDLATKHHLVLCH